MSRLTTFVVHVERDLMSPVRSEFGLAFLDAKERCNARTRHGTFDTSVLEINKDDLRVFLETLCEGGERY